MSSGSETSYSGKGKVISTRVFETGPPVPVVQQEVLNSTKTEEWTTKKKTDKLVTKQIETRVKREITVTDDGEIIEDSGPQVTTDTTEESRTEENENTEHKTSGCLDDLGPGWSLVPGSKVISETKQSNNSTLETREEKKDTEITEEVGGLSREEINRALKQKEQAALRAREFALTASPGPILQSSQSRKVIHTNEVNEVSEFKDGELSAETKRTSNHEEFVGDDLPETEALPPNWLSIAEARFSSAPTSQARQDENLVQTSSPSSCLKSGTAYPADPWDTVSDRLRQKKREERLRRLSEPESPRSTRRSTYIEQDDAIKRDTFDWIENHFGSQDLEEGGLTGCQVTISPASHHGSDPCKSSPSRLIQTIPVSSPDGSLRRVHYSKRQQMPSGRAVKSPAPPSPLPEMPWPKSKNNGHHSTSSSANLPKKQYYLGEDPGVGARFTGTVTRTPAGGHQDYGNSTQSLARSLNSRNTSAPVKYATLGHDAHLHEREQLKEKARRSAQSSMTKTKPVPLQPEVDLGPLPNVSDIIHSLRSKSFLEKENSAVSIRDDDSVFGPVPLQLYRPVRPPRHHRPAKQHVIKISIKSDDSDCSSPVNSPHYNGTPTKSSRAFEYQIPTSMASEEGDRGANDSIVKNAINNLLKNRLNSSSDKSPSSSANNSLSRQPKGSNLTSKTYLTISSPNVSKIETGPRLQKPSRYNAFNGSRSQSIGNLNHQSSYTGYSSRVPYHDATSNTGTPAANSHHETKRHQFMQRLLDNQSTKEELPTYRKYVPTPSRWSGSRLSPRTISPSSGSPPLSPKYTNRIRLPSSIPPSRTSSSPPPSPRSPPPPLTRPFSPNYQNNNRSYDFHNSNDYEPPPKPNYHRSRSSPRIFHSHSSSPPQFSRRPPSPVLPKGKGSSIGDDDSSSASGRSRSTNPGSRGSNISHPGERVEAVTRQKVTTTTTKKREIELPDSDYYYERSLPRDKAKSIVHIHDRTDIR